LTSENLLDTTGKSIFVQSEKLLHASTGIAGSAPALRFYFYAKYDGKAALNIGLFGQ